jgi:hypothetical protein
MKRCRSLISKSLSSVPLRTVEVGSEDPRKINLKSVAYFSALHKRVLATTFHHTNHHKLTTKTPRSAPHFLQKPLQTTTTLHPHFFRRQHKEIHVTDPENFGPPSRATAPRPSLNKKGAKIAPHPPPLIAIQCRFSPFDNTSFDMALWLRTLKR